MKISAYIPCYNNADTIIAAVEGVQKQTHPVDELFVVDDGSTDDSCRKLEELGITIVKMERNSGRGAVRARAMDHAQGELVLACDATNALAEDFLEKALENFSDEGVAGVYGRLTQLHADTAALRWRGRHLFKENSCLKAVHQSKVLSTWGCLVSKKAVMQVGNFNPSLSRCEDLELSCRLTDASYKILADPVLLLTSLSRNSNKEVLERFCRWYIDTSTETMAKRIVLSFKLGWRILLPEDIKAKDWGAAALSFLLPLYYLAAHRKKNSLAKVNFLTQTMKNAQQ